MTGRFFKYIPFLLFLCSLALDSCRGIDYYERNFPVTDHAWKHAEPVAGSFSITDTASRYNVYLILRHTDNYRFNNIWVELALKPPGDTASIYKLDLSLGNDAEGWEGTGLNDIWEVRKRLTSLPIAFDRPGEYSYRISHIMREDPLGSVMSVGLRVEKSH